MMRSVLWKGKSRITESVCRGAVSSYRHSSCSSSSSSTKKVPNFINGQLEESQASEWIPLLNPATQEVLCLVPQSTPDELRRAEIGAEEAFKKWREVPVQQRQVQFIVWS
jgi:malonate-semialdehyde dehydrogenase (acetylating)/methylmalonate-semialdehyde dehydrogenase